MILMTRCPEQKHLLRTQWCLWLVEAITLSIKTYRLKNTRAYIEKETLFCWQDYVKTRNAAYGNNSAAIGSQKRVSDSED